MKPHYPRLPRLPGYKARHRLKAEPMSFKARRPNTVLCVAIVELLGNGPLMKWQIRETLHEPEAAVARMLTAMRDDGIVKVVGKCLDKRAWALKAWLAPPPKFISLNPQRHRTKPKPLISWWAAHAGPDQPRQAFMAAALERDREAGWTGSGNVGRPHVPAGWAGGL